MPERLLRVLEDCGVTLSPQELLDILWLAPRLPQGTDAPLAHAAGSTPDLPDAGSESTPPSPQPVPDVPSSQAADPQPNQAYASPERTRPGTAGAGAGLSRARPIRLPEERAFPVGDLSLARALRPLKQRRTHGEGSELDEDATVAAYAGSGLLEVVMRPAQRRWLDLVLVVDDGLSMLLWRRLASELRALFERLGAFRDVRVYGLTSRGPDAPYLSARPFRQAANLSPAVVHDLSGRTLTLVISDGIGDAWRDGRLHSTLKSWAARGPTAVVHALPRRLWAGTGLRAEPWRVTSSSPGAANRSWRVDDPVLPAGLLEFDGLPVPLLELGPGRSPFRDWARLIASARASATLPLIAAPITPDALVTPATPNDPRPEPGAGAATDVMRFRDAASPQAYLLAAHLAAVAPATVAVMRLVQAAIPVDTAHLAEVFLGGLMRPVDERQPVELRSFDFDERAREILLDTVPAVQLAATRRTVGERIVELAGRSGTFPAWAPHPLGDEWLPRSRAAFATLPTQTHQPAEPSTFTAAPPEPARSLQSLSHPRAALVIATGNYTDESLMDLEATREQADALARLLQDPQIGDFDEVVVLNDSTIQELRVRIHDFLSVRGSDDSVVIHISGHGLLDARRRLYFAASDTEPARLASTGLDARFLVNMLDECRARHQLVILDCSFSGAFSRDQHGFEAVTGRAILRPYDRRREVLTSSRAAEYALMSANGSLFTDVLIEGLRTGNADLDGDDLISTSDLFAYARDRIVQQTPQRWVSGGERELILAHKAQPTAATPSSPADEQSSPIEPSARRICIAIDIAQFAQRGGAGQRDPLSRLVDLVVGILREIDVDYGQIPVTNYGDGLLFALPSDIRVDAVIGFIDAMKTARPRALNPYGDVLRLRVALSSGLVEEGAQGLIGEAVVHASRLLGSTELSEALFGHPTANPGIAIAISDDLFQELTSQADTTTVLRDFHRTHIELPTKGFSAEAWIYPDSVMPSIERELASLIGMNPFKDHLKTLRSLIVAQANHKLTPPLALAQFNSLFVGNPGTGKTTAAEIMGRMLHGEGLLSTSRITTETASGLLGYYVGQAGQRVAAAASSALDGILLIEDVGRFANDRHETSFGAQGLAALLQQMDSHRDRLVVVLADTPSGVARFLESYPALRGRFPHTVEFPDFSVAELMRIASRAIEERGLQFSDDSTELLGEIISDTRSDLGAGFGNARTIHALVDAIGRAWSVRIGRLDPNAPVTPDDLRSLPR